MRVGQAFPSKFLKVEDLAGARVAVTIDRVEFEDVGQGDKKEEKPVIYFRGKKKGLVCNKTNAESITEITGTDEMDDWTGVAIVLHPDKTKYAGKTVACIRIAEAATAVGLGKKKATPAVEVEADPEDDEANVGREPGDDDGDDEGFN